MTKARASGKVHACSECNRSFGSAQALASHRSATGHYPVHCAACNRGFGSHQALSQHAIVHSRPPLNSDASASQNSANGISRSMDEIASGMGSPKTDKVLEQHFPIFTLQVPTVSPNTTAQTFSGINAASGTLPHECQTLGMQSPHRKELFMHKSNAYTLLSPQEQDTIYSALLAACHRPEQLRVEHYTMPDEAVCKTNTSIHYSEFRKSPSPSLRPGHGEETKRKVVVLDCEMVGIYRDNDCLVVLSAVDLLTGETLLNTFVDPMVRVTSWRSRYSGVNPSIMKLAIKKGQALRGWKAARGALWKYVDAETILVGHALHHDLNVLGILHSRIVDSAILSAQAVFPDKVDTIIPRRWGLKNLCSHLLGMKIQTGRKGHDCLEDTLATREVVLWCLTYPDQLMGWAAEVRVEHERNLLEKKSKANEKANREEKQSLLTDSRIPAGQRALQNE